MGISFDSEKTGDAERSYVTRTWKAPGCVVVVTDSFVGSSIA